MFIVYYVLILLAQSQTSLILGPMSIFYGKHDAIIFPCDSKVGAIKTTKPKEVNMCVYFTQFSLHGGDSSDS